MGLVFRGLLLCLMLWGLPCVCVAAEGAEEGRLYTLEESVKEAILNNWTLKAKAEKIDQATFQKNQARADFLPKFSTSYGYTRYGQKKEIKTSFGTFESGSLDAYSWDNTVTQPVFTGFALLSTYRLAELGIDQSEMELTLEKNDLALKVKVYYFGILTADRAVDVAERAAEALGSHVEVARNFHSVGMIPINDLLQSEVELGNAQYDLIRAVNNAKLARSFFNTVLSRPVNAPVRVEDTLVEEVKSVDFQKSLETALKQRPEMKLMEIAYQQAEQQKMIAKSRLYPEVYVSMDYLKQGDTAFVNGGRWYQANQWQAMAGITWTYWEWGKTYYAIKQQESVKNEILKTKMALEETIQLEIKQAVLELEQAENNIPVTAKAAEQGEENLRVSEERYKAQVGTSTEVLDAQRYLTTARVNHYRSLYEYHIARARLLKAMGTY